MSIEIYVFSARRLDSIADWQQSIRSEGFNLEIFTEVSLAAVNGFLPARLGKTKTGFEMLS